MSFHMTPAEVRNELETLRDKKLELNLQLKMLEHEIEGVRLRCPHANKRSRAIHYANEYWTECADCGKTLS